jgi:hypothetical protein
LPADKKLRLGELSLRAGQRVRGRAGRRPLISISGAGLKVECEDICFEGIDFVRESSPPGRDKPNHEQAMITVAAQASRFRGCSFSCAHATEPVAIEWIGAADALPGSQGALTFSDCVFQGTAAIVDCRGTTGLSVDLTNALCVASGPIVRLHRCPSPGETFAISLDHTTTRGDSRLIECRYGRLESEPGQIVISVADSALVTNPGGALLLFCGPHRPDALARAISWNGQGSLITRDAVVALWRSRADKELALGEDKIEIGGLVRSEVEFAGTADGRPAASRITRWQAPLRSAEPPGAATDALFLPQ